MVRKLREVLNRHAEELDNEDLQAMAKAEARIQKKSKSKHPKDATKTNAELLAALRGTGQEVTDGLDADDSMLPYDPELESQLGFGLTKKGRRSFEEFLKMIQDEKNLLDVKRIRNDIVTQMRKKRAQIGKARSSSVKSVFLLTHVLQSVDREPGEIVNGEKVEDILKYLRRLSTAKKYADRRIEVLTGEKLTNVRVPT
jgi:sorting nexin-25